MRGVVQGDGEGDVVKETRVETVDFQSQAGQGGAKKEPVQVVHQHHPSSATGGSTGGVVSSAASAVARSIESAKEMLTGKGAGGDAN